ncbi:MAG: metal-dependent hydrolase [Synergistaceae bacterium]
MAKLKYLGHSAFYIEGTGIKALIDPFLEGPTSPIKPSDITDLNYIFLTHGHGDHIGNTIEIAKRTGATVITCFELATYLQMQGLKTEGMHIGGSYKFPFGKVKLTPAWHGAAVQMLDKGIDIGYGGVACGFLIEIENKKIYHAGDTGLTMEMQLLKDLDIQIAMLPIGGYYTMDAEDAARAVKMIKPCVAIPMHYNTFPLIAQNPEEFAKMVGEEETFVKILNPGEETEI